MREASYTSFRLGLYKPLKQLFKADKPDAESGDLDYLRTDFDRETTKKLFIDVSCRPDSPFILKFAAGGASGGLGSVVGNPFDILKTKMMASETGLGLAETAGSIFANQGVLGFYRGIDANIARAVVNNGTKMACYDQSKGLLQEHVGLSGISLQAAASFVAGFFMTCTVAPFDICRTRLMNQRRHRVARWGGVSRQKSIGVLFPGYCSESSRADCCERLGRRAPRETMVFVEISRITDWGPLRAPPGSRPPWGGYRGKTLRWLLLRRTTANHRPRTWTDDHSPKNRQFRRKLPMRRSFRASNAWTFGYRGAPQAGGRGQGLQQHRGHLREDRH